MKWCVHNETICFRRYRRFVVWMFFCLSISLYRPKAPLCSWQDVKIQWFIISYLLFLFLFFVCLFVCLLVFVVVMCLYNLLFNVCLFSPSELTFMWWGCCSLCLWLKPTEPAHSFLSCSCVCFCLFMALSTVFHSMNFPSNSLRSHSVLPVLFLPYWSIQLYISLWKSPSALI